MNFRYCIAIFSALLFPALTRAGSLQRPELQAAFERATAGFAGRVGVCAQQEKQGAKAGAVCVNGDQRFSLQSVVKLVAGMAVMDAVDHRGWKLDEAILVRKQDLSLYVQPIANLVGLEGFRTTTADLVKRAIVDSDSAAVDILIRKLGGPLAVQEFLNRNHVGEVRIDRDERHLQTEIVGIKWKPEFVDPAALDRAIEAVPKAQRDAAFKRYQDDIRDTATPRGMASLLQTLADEKILSPASSRHIFDVMTQTATGPDRLKAGVPSGWTIAHKTGTSGAWNGVTAATNDVGILKAPDGTLISIVVFIADSRAPAGQRAALMARLAALTVENYRSANAR